MAAMVDMVLLRVCVLTRRMVDVHHESWRDLRG
jgi:hypothetical protein